MWEQWLTSLSIWFQFPIVFLVVLPLSALAALGFMRAVDGIGVWFERRRKVVRQSHHAKTPTTKEEMES